MSVIKFKKKKTASNLNFAKRVLENNHNNIFEISIDIDLNYTQTILTYILSRKSFYT